jgi:hypothetical protein
MPFLHISPENSHTHEESIKTLKNAPIAFVLIYMDGCGPCNQVRPEWAQLENSQSLMNSDAVIADIDQVLLDRVSLNNPPNAFPNIRYITPQNKTHEEYDGERSAGEITNWIHSKIKNQHSNNHHSNNRHSKKTTSFRGGKRHKKRTRRTRRTRRTKRIKR